MTEDKYKLRTHDMPASKITHNLWLGNFENATDGEFLHREKINIVVNLMEQQPYFLSKIAMAHFPLTQPFGETLETFHIARAFLTQVVNANNNVLVHCWEGIDRSPTLVMEHLKIANNTGRGPAIRLIKEKRPVANPRLEWLVRI